MLHIFIRKPLAPRTLRQPHVSSHSPTRWLLFRLHFPRRAPPGTIFSGFGGNAALIAAMQDMVELGNRVAAFDADGHAKMVHIVRDPGVFTWGSSMVFEEAQSR